MLTKARENVISLPERHWSDGRKVVQFCNRPAGATVFTPDATVFKAFQKPARMDHGRLIGKSHMSSLAHTKLNKVLGGTGKIVLMEYMMSLMADPSPGYIGNKLQDSH